MAKVVEDYMMIIVFYVQTDTPRMEKDYNDNPVEKYDDVHMLSLKQIKIF